MTVAYRDLSKKQKLALVREAMEGGTGSTEEIAAVMAAVEKHYRGRSIPDDPQEMMNVMLRESWRYSHGDTVEWDAAARAAGVVVR